MTELIGRYEVIRQLGEGGMAVVYLALDPVMKRQVAIKVLPRQFTHDAQFRARFSREAQVIASLEHAAIVPVYDFGESDDQPYIVMRYMPGGSLADRMARGPLTAAEIASLFLRLAAALDVAHSHGIVHRDLKPANILFDQQGEPYLSDFGIVKLAETVTAHTGTGIIGTPAYMSPEQAGGKGRLDGRSDVYALGIILFELLTNAQPFTADTPMGVAVAHIVEPVPSILAMNPRLPREADKIIKRALAKQPEDRFQTAGDLAKAVTRLSALKGGSQVWAKTGARPGTAPNQPITTGLDAPPAAARVRTRTKALSVAALGLAGLLMLVCAVGSVLAAQRFGLGGSSTAPTAILSKASARVVNNVFRLTDTPSPTWTPQPTATFTASPTLTSTPSPTATATRRPTLAFTATFTPTSTNTPLPQCAPDEFYDPAMNRCRTNTQPASDSGSGGGSGGGSGVPTVEVPTIPPPPTIDICLLRPWLCGPVP